MPIAAILSVSEDAVDYQWFSNEGKQRHTGSIRWADVQAVDVFKRDLFTYDLICLHLWTPDQEAVEFDEEDPGWLSLTTVLAPRLPGCKSWGEWFSEVAFPAFESKRQRVFERNGKG